MHPCRPPGDAIMNSGMSSGAMQSMDISAVHKEETYSEIYKPSPSYSNEPITLNGSFDKLKRTAEAMEIIDTKENLIDKLVEPPHKKSKKPSLNRLWKYLPLLMIQSHCWVKLILNQSQMNAIQLMPKSLKLYVMNLIYCKRKVTKKNAVPSNVIQRYSNLQRTFSNHSLLLCPSHSH
jgi:hypothetical protein